MPPSISYFRCHKVYPLVEPNSPIFCPWALLLPATLHPAIQTYPHLTRPTSFFPNLTAHISPARKQWPDISSLGCTCPSYVPPTAQQNSDVLTPLTLLSTMGLEMCREEDLSGCCLCSESCGSKDTAKVWLNLFAGYLSSISSLSLSAFPSIILKDQSVTRTHLV